jgi:CarD family transcriptional regulator
MEHFVSLGDYVVCPGHGVGQIVGTEEKSSFLIVKLISSGAKILVPESNRAAMRPLVAPTEMDIILGLLNQKDVTIDRSTWNRRQRDYLQKINTGSLQEVAEGFATNLTHSPRKKVELWRKKDYGSVS